MALKSAVLTLAGAFDPVANAHCLAVTNVVPGPLAGAGVAAVLERRHFCLRKVYCRVASLRKRA